MGATVYISIESDADFIAQGWSGNGTSSNPFTLSQETYSGDIYIRIAHTRSYFRIENCTFSVDNFALILQNVTNANITQNSIITMNRGIDINNSENLTVQSNIILGGYEGIFSYKSNNCSILNNTIANIRTAIAFIDMSNSTIIGNRLASVEEVYTAVDSGGSNNHWDDGISHGNAWYHYNGTGVYNIPGSTNSIDHFPTRFDPIFPIDFEGPVILAALGPLYVDYMYEYPSHWRFIARVSDPSGVEMVTITVNGAVHEMVHQPTTEEPDLYIYDHVHPRMMTYSYWAVDSLGYETETGQGFISIGVFAGPSPPSMQTMVLLQIGIISFCIILVVWWKRDAIRNSRFLKDAIQKTYH
ncbi:MAG: NosD domain-containing protein [Candidatus Thorarchaeota archaeon]